MNLYYKIAMGDWSLVRRGCFALYPSLIQKSTRTLDIGRHQTLRLRSRAARKQLLCHGPAVPPPTSPRPPQRHPPRLDRILTPQTTALASHPASKPPVMTGSSVGAWALPLRLLVRLVDCFIVPSNKLDRGRPSPSSPSHGGRPAGRER